MTASDKIAKGEPVFLFFDFENLFARVEEDGCFLKRKGEEEYRVDRDTTLLIEAILNNNQISKEKYLKG